MRRDKAQATPKTFRELFVDYEAAHRHRGTRLTHMLGIPMIVASLPIALVRPRLALSLFVGGWALQFLGHYGFEKNDPQFFGDKRNLLVGVWWSVREWAALARWRRRDRGDGVQAGRADPGGA